MQLKLKRSLRETGLLTKTAVFCLDARADFAVEERRAIDKYKLGGQIIYSSELQKQRFEAAQQNLGQGALGSLKAIGMGLMARMSLSISINSLAQGQHVECKDLPELLDAETAIYTACENLKNYLAMANTFDGRETVVDFSGEKPTIAGGQLTGTGLITANA